MDDTRAKYEELDEDMPLEMQEKIDEMEAIKESIEVSILMPSVWKRYDTPITIHQLVIVKFAIKDYEGAGLYPGGRMVIKYNLAIWLTFEVKSIK